MFRLNIETDNDAFANGNLGDEIRRILHQLGDDIHDEFNLNETHFTLRDINGNRVGYARFEDK